MPDHAPDTDRPQIYLITPPEFEPEPFADRLAAVLDLHQIACIRLALASKDHDRIARIADALRQLAHDRDVALVIDSHVQMVERLGLDGVHLTDGARSVRKVRKELGPDAIVGTFCGASQHEGMTAGEAGADYVAFGPVGPSPLGDGTLAGQDLFAWWSEVIEVPVVAEGFLTPERVAELAPVTDFLAIGTEIWDAEDAATALSRLLAPLG